MEGPQPPPTLSAHTLTTVIVPHKMRICSECKKDILCDNCDKLVNQKKKFSANLNELKREKPNDQGHMLPNYIIT